MPAEFLTHWPGSSLPVLSSPGHLTSPLHAQAQTFQQTGRQLRSKMWWQNMKMKLALAALVIIIIFVIFLIVCFSGRNCFK